MRCQGVPSAHNPQATFWKKLRLMKKCVFCRNKKQKQHLCESNIAKHNLQADSKLLSMIGISFCLEDRKNVPMPQLELEKQMTNRQSCHWSYYSLSVSEKEIKNLSHYYRFYDQKPVVPGKMVFQILTSYNNKKKTIEYNRIKMLFSPEKTGNTSTKYKTGVVSSERVLEGLLESHQSQCQVSREELSIFRQTGFTSNKTLALAEIDRKYTFGRDIKKRKQKWLNASSAKLQTYHNFRVFSKSKKKRNYNSCGNLLALQNASLEKSGCRYKMDPLEPEKNEKKFRSYVATLKQKIKLQKNELTLATTSTKRKKGKRPKNKSQKRAMESRAGRKKQSSEKNKVYIISNFTSY